MLLTMILIRTYTFNFLYKKNLKFNHSKLILVWSQLWENNKSSTHKMLLKTVNLKIKIVINESN